MTRSFRFVGHTDVPDQPPRQGWRPPEGAGRRSRSTIQTAERTEGFKFPAGGVFCVAGPPRASDPDAVAEHALEAIAQAEAHLREVAEAMDEGFHDVLAQIMPGGVNVADAPPTHDDDPLDAA